MRGNRTLLVVVAFLILIIATGAFLLFRMRQAAPEPGGLEEETPPVIEYIDIVVSAQNPIPRGWRFEANDGAASLQQWPVNLLPPSGYLSSLSQLQGMHAKMDIPQGAPILFSMVSESAIAQFPNGRIAYTVLMDIQGGAAWWLESGDHVDVLAAISLTNVDTEFQAELPNQFIMLPDPNAESQQSLSGTFGRFETLPNGRAGLVYPANRSIPNIVVELVVQDAIVWQVGTWRGESETSAAMAAAPTDTASVGGIAIQAAPPPAATAVPVLRGEVEPVVLVVTHQDALVLKYLQEIGADLDLAVRPVGDTTLALTQPVWLRYVLDRYQLPSTGSDLPVAPLQLREPLKLTPLPTPLPEGQ